jgi:hypothetical protein
MARPLPLVALACALSLSLACETAKSANPLSPDIAGPIDGVAITAPMPLEPPPGGHVVRGSTPPVLVAQNATTSGERPLYLEFQVATDENFEQIVHHAPRVPPGPGGQTEYRLPEHLSAGPQYYWRARAADGANVGPYSMTVPFTVVDPVIIEPPTPVEPAGDISTTRPVFRVRNARIEGTTDAFYRFEVATSPDPAAIVAVVNVRPGANGETTMSLGDLPPNRTFYWRVSGSDGVTDGPHSPFISFTTGSNSGGGGNGGGGGGGGGGTGGGGGSGSGPRTPDPPPGARLPEPNGLPIVEAVARQYPHFLLRSCQEHGGTWDFMDTLVDTLRRTDTRYGYIWKRGVVGDPLMDVVGYNWSSEPDEGTRNVYTFDVIGGHCGPNPTPTWVNTQPGGGPGQSVWTGRGRF